jgi:hypothetical protein
MFIRHTGKGQKSVALSDWTVEHSHEPNQKELNDADPANYASAGRDLRDMLIVLRLFW